MMKTPIHHMMCIVALALPVMTVSCAKSNGNGSASISSDAPTKDSIEATADTWQADSAKAVCATTYDRTYLEVHGPVHTVALEENPCFVFDEAGKLVEYDGYDPFKSDIYNQGNYDDIDFTVIHLKRDKQGRITEEGGWEWGTTYTWKDDRIVTEMWGEGGMYGKYTFHYDADGRLISKTGEEGEELDESSATKVKFVYTKRDRYGNWIENRKGDEVTKRHITYYALPGKKYTGCPIDPTAQTYDFEGSIGGENGCPFTIGPDGGNYKVSSGERRTEFGDYYAADGTLVVNAYAPKTGKFLGYFEGKYDPTAKTYKGTFRNTKGATVPFNLKQR
ncbi:MAG: hypothetical protein Q4B68_06995 [Bacteroidales bacterium]|nr:hypothetical protein [Bacteroidales bacterium]